MDGDYTFYALTWFDNEGDRVLVATELCGSTLEEATADLEVFLQRDDLMAWVDSTTEEEFGAEDTGVTRFEKRNGESYEWRIYKIEN